MLSLSHRFLFLPIPKTAGHAVQRALLPFSEDRIVRLGLGRPPLSKPPLSKVNVGELRDYRRYYARPGSVDRVAEKFRHDIARFGYGFE